jgi:hypothetical protein
MKHAIRNSVVCLLSFFALGSGTLHAQTHVGAAPDDLVILAGDGFMYDPGGGSILDPSDFTNALLFTTRIRPDGTEVANYEIPNGKALVVTEVNWAYRSQPNHTYCLVLSVGTSDPPAGSTPDMHQSCMHTDGDGIGYVSESFTTGFVVHNNERLYTAGPWDPHHGGPNSGGDYMGSPDGSDVLVRGYLVDERPVLPGRPELPGGPELPGNDRRP